MLRRHGITALCTLALLGCVLLSTHAADTKPDAAPAGAKTPGTAPAQPTSKDQLANEQAQLAARYKNFEDLILRMAELTASSDPRRAALLRRAVAESKDQLIQQQLQKISDTLRKGPLGTAAQNQGDVEKDLAAILELLMSEQRGDRLKDEREKLKEQIRRIKELINRQTQIQGQSQAAGDPLQQAQPQGKLADDTGKLAQEMKPAANKGAQGTKPDEGKKPADGQSTDEKPKPGEQKPGEPKNSEAKPEGKDSKTPGEGKSDEAKKPDGPAKPGDKASPPADSPPQKSPGKDGAQPKSDGQPSPMPGEGEDSPPSDSSAPKDKQQSSQQRVAKAQQKMQQAQKKLEQAQRDGAKQDQEDAVRELELAKADLEAILRQLREEEQARTLAQLEARFRKMLEMQREVYEGTLRLDRVPAKDRTTNDELESGRLSRKESLILAEADKALAILREDGSASAFPEAVEQLRSDIEAVVGYLARFKVDTITQGVEEDIIAAIEEMIAALQKAQKQQQDQKGKPQPGQGGPQDPPLLDQLAELKMIRALQMRVNTRTQKYNKLVDGAEGAADKPDLVEALRGLADRERRIFDRTRDIVTGRNQ